MTALSPVAAAHRPPAADMTLASQVGFAMPVTRAVLPGGVSAELGALAALIESPVPPDADPARVAREVPRLRSNPTGR